MSRHCYFLFVMQLVRAELVAVQLDLARTAVDRTNLIQSSIVSYERGRWMRRATAGIVDRVSSAGGLLVATAPAGSQ